MKLPFSHCLRAQPAVVLWGLISLTMRAQLAADGSAVIFSSMEPGDVGCVVQSW